MILYSTINFILEKFMCDSWHKSKIIEALYQIWFLDIFIRHGIRGKPIKYLVLQVNQMKQDYEKWNQMFSFWVLIYLLQVEKGFLLTTYL